MLMRVEGILPHCFELFHIYVHSPTLHAQCTCLASLDDISIFARHCIIPMVHECQDVLKDTDCFI